MKPVADFLPEAGCGVGWISDSASTATMVDAPAGLSPYERIQQGVDAKVTEQIIKGTGSLISRLGSDEQMLTSSSEEAWIEVIQKMDLVYADLVRYQVELEEKNSALEEAQRFIESVQAAMTDVLIVCDIQGRIQQANTALERITGRSEKELLNLSFKELFVESSQYLVDGFADKIRSETVYDCEVNLISADGTPTPLAMNCSSRYDHNGRLVGMVLIGRPVGELRRAYEELHATHKELKQAQEQLVHSEKMASRGRLVAGVPMN